MNISKEEEKDGVRIVWNVMPNSKIQLGQASIPQALHYTPFSQLTSAGLSSIPEICTSCGSSMNCYNKINRQNLTYQCCICKSVVKLPVGYLSSNKHNQFIEEGERQNSYPQQLLLDSSTYQYHIKNTSKIQKKDKSYIFIVDLCMEQKQLKAVQESLLELIDQSSDYCRACLILFDRNVHLYNFTSSISTRVTIPPFRHYNQKEVQQILEIDSKQIKQNKTHASSKYFADFRTQREVLIQKVKGLLKNKIKSSYRHERPARAVGQALNIALNLNKSVKERAKLVLICGGPCTIGVGKIIETDYKFQMRSINEEIPKQSVQAKSFYSFLKALSVASFSVIDSFLFGVQEVGLMEMYDCLAGSGGLIVQHQQFQSEIFRKSFRNAYIGDEENPALELVCEAKLKVICSKQILINGLLGSGVSIPGDNRYTSNKVIGNGKTNTWYLGQLSQSKTITMIYDISQSQIQSEAYYIQLHTTYVHPNHPQINTHRITTIRRLFNSQMINIAEGFDQESALVLLTKLVIYKGQSMKKDLVISWLDDILCKWAKKFAYYMKGDDSSFKLCDKMKWLPQYIYHLRRGFIMKKFGISWDEFIYRTHIINQQSVQNILTIVQPALIQYSLDSICPRPVALDEKSMKDEVILLLDSYFNLVEWYGPTLYSWYEHRYQEMEDYKHIKDLLDAPKQDISYIANNRFPPPQQYFTYAGHSKERFIKSRVNPNKSNQHENRITDDADIATFTKHMIDLVVNQKA